MSERLIYLDSSAIVKLVLPEPETEALLELLAGNPERITSALARVEVMRAARRVGESASTIRRAEEVLNRLGLFKVDTEVIKIAAGLDPRGLRALDAIHLATALCLGDQLGGMVVYDTQLAEAAEANGLSVLAPGRG